MKTPRMVFREARSDDMVDCARVFLSSATDLARLDAGVGDAKVGVVTSGTQTPFLKKAIGMAYLPAEQTAPGTEFDVDIRGRRTRAHVVPMPFYKRPK